MIANVLDFIIVFPVAKVEINSSSSVILAEAVIFRRENLTTYHSYVYLTNLKYSTFKYCITFDVFYKRRISFFSPRKLLTLAKTDALGRRGKILAFPRPEDSI